MRHGARRDPSSRGASSIMDSPVTVDDMQGSTITHTFGTMYGNLRVRCGKIRTLVSHIVAGSLKAPATILKDHEFYFNVEIDPSRHKKIWRCLSGDAGRSWDSKESEILWNSRKAASQ